MRMSCNGCRVLRKGCSDDCNIRPCLEWIKCPRSQANATLFLAKFYGRAGLTNLINSGQQNLRPAIFLSLLFEACGRIVNPVYGSVGLLWSGNWNVCQAAVEAVLRGEPITPIASASDAARGPPWKSYDIRHLSKAGNSEETQRVKNRSRLRRAVKPVKPVIAKETGSVEMAYLSESLWSEPGKDNESGVSVETAFLFHEELESEPKASDRAEEGVSDAVGLELRLGIEPVSREPEYLVPIKKRKIEMKDNVCFGMELGLKLGA